MLTATLLHRVSHFEASRNPNIVPLSGACLPNADSDAPSPLCQSILGSVIGMSRAAIQAREHNIDLYHDGILQALVEKGDAGRHSGTGKKAEVRARKEAKEADKRARTIAKLKRRADEREDQISRRETKHRNLEKTLAPMAKSVPNPKPQKFDLPPVDVARQILADADDSRYSIASPGPSARQAHKKAQEVMYIDDSEDENSSADSEDDDVVVGGSHGGDRLVATKKQRAPEPEPDTILLGDDYDEMSERGEDELEDDSSDGSGDLAVQSLVPRAAATASGESKDKKKAKADARAAYWASKGSREQDTITLDSD